MRETDVDVTQTEFEERADVSGSPVRGDSETEGDSVVPFSAPVWTGCPTAAACWTFATFCAGGGVRGDDASLGATAGRVDMLTETGVIIG